MAAKTQKELAFLRDLYIDAEWTQRFTELVDKHTGLAEEENFLYINAGTGNHALVLGEKAGRGAEFFAVCENADLLTIARDKAAAVKSNVKFSPFSMEDFEAESFGAILADATFVDSANLANFIAQTADLTEIGGKVAFFTVSAGSFGEIFSLLWEVLFSADLGGSGVLVEQIISELPTVSRLTEIAREAGLEDVETHQSIEIFEYESGAEFVNSPLVADFLLPEWLKTLNDNEKEQVTKKLAQLVDEEDGTLTFRFSVKPVLIIAVKA